MHPRLHEHLQAVGRRALKLRRVLDDVDAVGRVLGDDLDERVGERRLARARPAADEDVVVARARRPRARRAGGARGSRGSRSRRARRRCARAFGARRRARRRSGGWRPEGAHPTAAAASPRARGSAALSSTSTSEATRRSMRSASAADTVTRVRTHPLADPLHPDDAVGVEHHLDDARVVEQVGERPERALERAGAPRLALGQLGSGCDGTSVHRSARSEVLREIDRAPRDCAREPSGAPGPFKESRPLEVRGRTPVRTEPLVSRPRKSGRRCARIGGHPPRRAPRRERAKCCYDFARREVLETAPGEMPARSGRNFAGLA